MSDNYNYEGYEEEDNEEEEVEVGGELPPDAKEYYEYKNQIDIMEKEKELLESTLEKAKQTYKSNKKLEKTKQRSPFKKYDSSNYKEYEKKILSNMMDDQLFEGIGTSKDILGKFAGNKTLQRNIYCRACRDIFVMVEECL